MKHPVKYAVLNFCPDLTDPSSRSIPVAMVAVVELSKASAAVFVGAERFSEDRMRDPFGILADLARFLDTRVQEGLAESGPSGLLEFLQKRLRHSFAFGLTAQDIVELTEEDQSTALMTGLLRIYRHVIVAPVPTPGTSFDLPTLHVQQIAHIAA